MSFLPCYFNPNNTDFIFWCHEAIREALSITESYERNWVYSPYSEKEYLNAMVIKRQYEVLLTTMNERQKSFFENRLRHKKHDLHIDSEYYDYKEIFENWVLICCQNSENKLKSIDKIRLGVTLQHLREEKHLTRAKVSELTGINTSTLKSYESGQRMMRLDCAYKLAQIYDIGIDEIIKKSY